MADFFQNGLYLPGSGSYGGGMFCRWLVEFCTQVAGMTLLDSKAGDTQWTATVATGVNGTSVVGNAAQLNIAGDSYTFTSADLWRYLTITGMTPSSRNGIYRISKIISTKIVELEIQFGVHENGIPPSLTSLTWRLWAPTSSYYPPTNSWAVIRGTYTGGGNWDLHIQNQDYASPYWTLGPYATWNAGTHAWSTTDTRNTSQIDIQRAGIGNQRYWAVADSGRVCFMSRDYSGNTNSHMGYFGEMTAFFPANDLGPMVGWGGVTNIGTMQALFGGGVTIWSTDIVRTTRILGSDDRSTIEVFFELPDVQYEASYWGPGCRSGYQRRWSQYSKKLYKWQIGITYPWGTLAERRGVLKNVWATSNLYSRLIPVGASKEYLHLGFGLLIPWNGSGTYAQPQGTY